MGGRVKKSSTVHPSRTSVIQGNNTSYSDKKILAASLRRSRGNKAALGVFFFFGLAPSNLSRGRGQRRMMTTPSALTCFVWVVAYYPALTRREVNSRFLWPVWSVPHPTLPCMYYYPSYCGR